jgi:hypothetical protein
MCRVMCKTFWYRVRLVSWLEYSSMACHTVVALQMQKRSHILEQYTLTLHGWLQAWFWSILPGFLFFLLFSVISEGV